jgi:hypothetical protein
MDWSLLCASPGDRLGSRPSPATSLLLPPVEQSRTRRGPVVTLDPAIAYKVVPTKAANRP